MVKAAADNRVTSVDRLGFTLFMAVAVHAILLLGVGFEVPKTPRIAHTLEVTLAQFSSEKAPDEADFIAQHNQQGSGEAAKKARPSNTEQALLQSNDAPPLASRQQPLPVAEVDPQPQPAPAAKASNKRPQPDRAAVAKTTKKPPVVVTEAKRPARKVTPAVKPSEPPAPSRPTTGLASSLLARSLEIASLEARLDLQKQALASSPRVRRLYSASTRESYDAAYLEAWRRKVERVGNMNYPEEAHRRGLYGHLRLLVVIEPDGALQRVEVLKSSGYSVLDDAAKRIVYLSAPFAPFPPEIRKRADLVEIIRTWRFEKARFGINS